MLASHTRRCLSWRFLAVFPACNARCSGTSIHHGSWAGSGTCCGGKQECVPFITPALLCMIRLHSDATGDRSKPLTLHVQLPDGTTRDVKAYEGQTLLDVAMEERLPIEGACGGSCACSTCHVYLENEAAMELFDEPTDEENDMLDMAFFPQVTSRLGCQLRLVQKKHDGLKITLPHATRNMYVDGHTVTPHN
ncbi:electron transfer protein [Trypanosoma rangeli]|uniref:Electron transfer protein n=1 Tax=Trypanosoma rangeli TaxID=5698 RepID=A0A3R7NM96_TRYRA|nr:electron transfer protein [Trypanosoma rangeli]RNF08536.1 electron transfer protein [Trypanosoma rangeli]|eukprot:RNF08536.1 electron transfer protein [Trypanosoma rangeli]